MLPLFTVLSSVMPESTLIGSLVVGPAASFVGGGGAVSGGGGGASCGGGGAWIFTLGRTTRAIFFIGTGLGFGGSAFLTSGRGGAGFGTTATSIGTFSRIGSGCSLLYSV